MAAAVPVPGIHTVIETAYTTVWVTAGAATETAAPVTVSSAPPQAATPTTLAAVPTTAAATTAAPTTEAPAPTTQPTTTEAPLPSPTVQTPASASASSLPTGSTNSGQGTYYDTGMGACGFVSSDLDYIVAISKDLFEPHNVNGNPNKNTLCNKKIRAFYGGNSVDVTVVDQCMGCKTNDLDFSPSAFSQLASKDLGRIDITWEWAS